MVKVLIGFLVHSLVPVFQSLAGMNGYFSEVEVNFFSQ